MDCIRTRVNPKKIDKQSEAVLATLWQQLRSGQKFQPPLDRWVAVFILKWTQMEDTLDPQLLACMNFVKPGHIQNIHRDGEDQFAFTETVKINLPYIVAWGQQYTFTVLPMGYPYRPTISSSFVAKNLTG